MTKRLEMHITADVPDDAIDQGKILAALSDSLDVLMKAVNEHATNVSKDVKIVTPSGPRAPRKTKPAVAGNDRPPT